VDVGRTGPTAEDEQAPGEAAPPEGSTQRQPERLGRYARLRHSIGRHPADLVRIAVAAGVVLACVVAARAPGANEVEVAIFHEIQRLPGWSTRAWRVLTWFGSWPGIVAAAGLALYLGRVRMAVAATSSSVLAWLLALLLHAVVDPRVLAPALLAGSVRSPAAGGFPFPSVHVAVIAALATAAWPYVTRVERYGSGALVVGVAVADLFLGANLPLGVFAGAVLGWGAAVLVHLVLGAPGRRSAEPSVEVACRQAGLVPERVVREGRQPLQPQLYQVTSVNGERLQMKVVRRLHRLAGPAYKLRRILASVEVENEPALSTPRHEVEHEAYVTLLAERAGVGTLPVLLAGEIEHGPPFLIRQQIDGRQLASMPAGDVDDALLDEVWRNVVALGAARIAHHDLRASSILVDAGGGIRITDFTFSRVGGPDGQNCQDVADALVSLTSVVGSARAVDSALRAVPRQTLVDALPHLQSLALHSRVRKQLPDRGVLVELRATLAERLGCTLPPFRSPVRPATVAILATGGVAVYLLLPEFASIGEVRSVIARANWVWLGIAAVCGELAIVANAWTILGAARDPLPVGRTVGVQVAAAFTGRTTVAAVGYYAILMSFLERLGLRRTDAVGVLILNRAATTLVTALATVLGVLVIGHAVPVGNLSVPWWAVAAAAGLVAAAAAFLASPYGRRRVWRRVVAMTRQLLTAMGPTLRQPLRWVQLVGGEVAFLAFTAAGIVATLSAIGAHFSLVPVVGVYIVASNLGQLLPTPGGLGAVEGALVAGLSAIGIPAPTAIAAALISRVLTFWLPVVPGVVAFRLLQRRGVI
jgi:undecaprenyl-diphosphatase